MRQKIQPDFDSFIRKNRHVVQHVFQKDLAALVAADDRGHLFADVVLEGGGLVYDPLPGLYRIHAAVQAGQLLVIPLVHHSHLVLCDTPGEEGVQDSLLLFHNLTDLIFQPLGAFGACRLPFPDCLHGDVAHVADDPLPVHLQGGDNLFQNVQGQIVPDDLADVAAYLVALGVQMPLALVGSGITAPEFVVAAVPFLPLSGYKAGSALAAFDFSTEHIAIGMASP